MVHGTRRLGLAIAGAQVLAGLVLLPVAWTQSRPLAGAMVLLFGLFSGPMTVWAQTIRMRLVPAQWRGRAFATLRMIMQSGRLIGGAVGGGALAVLPLGVSIVATGAVIAVPAIVGALHPGLRRADQT